MEKTQDIGLSSEKVTALNPKPTGITVHVEMAVDDAIKHKAVMLIRLFRHDDGRNTTFGMEIPTMSAKDMAKEDPPITERFTLSDLITSLQKTLVELQKVRASHEQQFGQRIITGANTDIPGAIPLRLPPRK